VRGSRLAAAKLMREGALIPPSPALRIVFPGVEELRVELEFIWEPGWMPSNQLRILRPAARASFRYPCPFAGCSGWFELDEPVRRLVECREHSVASKLGCTGVRPGDRASGKTCQTQVRYVIKASYMGPKA
jgi:hypothetical protein